MNIIAYRISLHYATFSIDVEEGRVIDAAPIARWMIGKSITDVIKWVRGKKGTIETLNY